MYLCCWMLDFICRAFDKHCVFVMFEGFVYLYVMFCVWMCMDMFWMSSVWMCICLCLFLCLRVCVFVYVFVCVFVCVYDMRAASLCPFRLCTFSDFQ